MNYNRHIYGMDVHTTMYCGYISSPTHVCDATHVQHRLQYVVAHSPLRGIYTRLCAVQCTHQLY